MPWSESHGSRRLTVLGLPDSVKCQLVKQKALTGRSFARQICESLVSTWQRQGLMAASPICDEDWSQPYIPPVVPHPVVAQQNYVPPQRLAPPPRLAPGKAIHNGAVYRVQSPKVLPLPPDDFV
jgi:hypothetical protein